MRIQNTEFQRFFTKSFVILNSAFWTFPYVYSQQKNLPLNREWSLGVEKIVDTILPAYITTINECYSPVFFTNFKPYTENSNIDWAQVMDLNYAINNLPIDKGQLYDYKKEKYLMRKIKYENLFILRDSSDNFLLTIDPLFNFEYGKDLSNHDSVLPSTAYKNMRGILVRGDIGTKFSFESSFAETQATFVRYIDDYVKSTNNLFPNDINYPYNVIPGQGRAKVFKKNGYDFGMASGYISYSPSKHFNFQAGHGKHFVGDGYRSLLLSDNAFNYPFLRITTSFGKFQYTNLYASFMNLTDGGVKTPPGTERLFQKKAAGFQFLSWNVHRRIQLGLFQGMIWKASDNKNRQYVDLNYFNPVIFANAGIFSLSHEKNVLLGSTLKLKATNSISFYGQYMMDGNNKTGFQAGAKYLNLLGLPNLHLQVEYNSVQPYSYAHTSPAQSYSHYNQPLAHPLGANLREGIAFLNYRIGDFFAEARFSLASAGTSFAYNYGSNIFLSDTFNLPVINSIEEFTSITHKYFHIGYLVNPSTNLNVVAGYSGRQSSNSSQNSVSDFLFIGIRTSLSNVYYDF